MSSLLEIRWIIWNFVKILCMIFQMHVFNHFWIWIDGSSGDEWFLNMEWLCHDLVLRMHSSELKNKKWKTFFFTQSCPSNQKLDENCELNLFIPATLSHQANFDYRQEASSGWSTDMQWNLGYPTDRLDPSWRSFLNGWLLQDNVKSQSQKQKNSGTFQKSPEDKRHFVELSKSFQRMWCILSCSSDVSPFQRCQEFDNFFCLFIYLFVCLFVCLFVSLFVC